MSLLGTLGVIAGGIDLARTVASGISSIGGAIRGGGGGSQEPGNIRQAVSFAGPVSRNGAAGRAGAILASAAPVGAIGPTAAQFRIPPIRIPRMPSGTGAVVGFGAGVLSEILAQARAFTGAPVSRNKIIDAAKACGIELAAQTFGLSETEVCSVIAGGRSRRSRGISSRDIRNCNRIAKRISTFRSNLKKATR